MEPSSTKVLATLELVLTSELGGVYGYLDNRNRVAVIDGSRYLKFVAWRNNEKKKKELYVEVQYDLRNLIEEGDDSIGIVPSWGDAHLTWFATKNGFVGYINLEN